MDANISKSIGTGLIFPIQLISGKPVTKSGAELITSDLIQLFSWPIMSRYFKESYGVDLKDFLGEQNDDVLFDVLRTYVIWAITEWEKRIELVSAEITRDDLGVNLNIILTYKIIATNKQEDLIIPVYNMTA